jgi:gamma-glutamylcyclotransferase (GGCT)/AIG2-like uncharacterized protein YtfP
VNGTLKVELFVNGTLMRGDVLHRNLDGARFISEARTAPRYRLYSIGDVHPGMIDAETEGVSVSGELYELDLEHLERIIASEPPGLGVGVVELAGGERRLGIFWVASELPDTAIDISEYGGWREYRGQSSAKSGVGDSMKRLEGKFLGPVFIREDTSFHGMVEGDVSVAPGVTLLAHGMIAGNLDIGLGATVELRGMVAGSSLNRGRLKVYGVVRGFMRDEEGGQTTLADSFEAGGERRRSGSRRRRRQRSASDL